MASRDILFADAHLSVERLRAVGSNATRLAFVFNHLGSRFLNEDVGGGDFLNAHGFDVVLLKTTARDWYQSLPEAAFAAIDTAIGPHDYTRRVAMGSSMGGFAAICFSKRLRCDVVLAYAPQHDVTIRADPRFSGFIEHIVWTHRVEPATVSTTCRYSIVYDPRDHYDATHADCLRTAIGARNLTQLHVPFAGHAVAVYLMEIGQLKRVTLDVLAGIPVPAADLRRNRRRSAQYLSVLAVHLRLRRHVRLADAVIRLAGYPYRPLPLSRWAFAHRVPVAAAALETVEVSRLRRLRFDARFYAHVHYDVPDGDLASLRHYIRHGWREGRVARFSRTHEHPISTGPVSALRAAWTRRRKR